MFVYVNDILTVWEKAPNRQVCNSQAQQKVKTTTAPDDLFKVDNNTTKLSLEMATAFHNIVAKVLYLVYQARLDTLVSITFLTTRIQAPNVDN